MEKKIFIVMLFAITSFVMKAQFDAVITGPMQAAQMEMQAQQLSMQGEQLSLQSEQLTNAISTLKSLKEAQETYSKMKGELNEIKSYAKKAEETVERVKQLGNLGELKLSNLGNLLNHINCINGQSFFRNDFSFKWIVDMFLNGLIKCDNDNIYLLSYGGLGDKIEQKFNGSNNNGFVNNSSSNNTMASINSSLTKLDKDVTQAAQMHSVTASASKKATLEVAQRYKVISEELMTIGRELYEVAKDDKAIEINKAERLNLMGKGLDYQIKSMDYLKSYHDYLAIATAESPEDVAKIEAYKRSLYTKQFGMFRK